MPVPTAAARARWLRQARAVLLAFALLAMGLALANHDHDRLPPGQAGCAVCLQGTAGTPLPTSWQQPELPLHWHARPFVSRPSLLDRAPAGTLRNRGPPRLS